MGRCCSDDAGQAAHACIYRACAWMFMVSMGRHGLHACMRQEACMRMAYIGPLLMLCAAGCLAPLCGIAYAHACTTVKSHLYHSILATQMPNQARQPHGTCDAGISMHAHAPACWHACASGSPVASLVPDSDRSSLHTFRKITLAKQLDSARRQTLQSLAALWRASLRADETCSETAWASPFISARAATTTFLPIYTRQNAHSTPLPQHSAPQQEEHDQHSNRHKRPKAR